MKLSPTMKAALLDMARIGKPMIAPPTNARTLIALATRGLVRCRPADDPRRGDVWEVTDAGRAAIAEPIEPTPADMVQASAELVAAFGGVAPEIVDVVAVVVADDPARAGDPDFMADVAELLAPVYDYAPPAPVASVGGSFAFTVTFPVELCETYVHAQILDTPATLCGITYTVEDAAEMQLPLTLDYDSATCPRCVESLESIADYLARAERYFRSRPLRKHKPSGHRRNRARK